MAALAALRARLLEAGLPTRPTGRSFAEFGGFAALAGAFLAGALAPSIPILLRAVCVVAAAWFWMAAAMCGHDAAHGTACRTSRQNRFLGRLSLTLMGGIAYPYWVHRHGRHHAHPNVDGKDPDIEHGLSSYSASRHEKQPQLLRKLQRWFNAPAFWLSGSLMIWLEMRLSSLRHLRRTRAPLSEWVWMLGHYALMYGLPLLIVPAKTVLLIHLMGQPLISAFLLIALAPGHFADPLVERPTDPIALQVAVSRNFRPPLGVARCLNGLHRHIEHHLAPHLNHFDLETAAPLIRSFVEEQGWTYRETGWGQALADVDRHLRLAWRMPDLDFSVPAAQSSSGLQADVARRDSARSAA